MKKLSDFTTTELLLIAHKAKKEIYDENIYHELCKKATEQNYTSCIAYAEDLRFKKLLDIYKEKREIQRKLLESRMELPTKSNEVLLDGIEKNEPLNLQRNQETKKTSIFTDMNEILTTDLISLERPRRTSIQRKPLGSTAHPSNLFSFQIKQDNNTSGAQVIPHNQNKQAKIFYRQMTDEEKEIDDFLDKLQERNHGKIKSKNLTRNIGISDRDSPNVFNFIVEKVTNRKGVKDKNLWPAEFKIISEKLKSELDIVSEINNDTQLIHACLPILMKLQQLIFDGKELDKAIFFKKLLISFFDFYRK